MQWDPAFDHKFFHVYLQRNIAEIVRQIERFGKKITCTFGTVSERRTDITVRLHGVTGKQQPLLWTIIIEWILFYFSPFCLAGSPDIL